MLLNPIGFRQTITAGAPPAPGLEPVAGMKIWLDGSDISTLFQDTGGSTPITTDGQNIARWEDISGNSYHAIGTGFLPTYKATATNGLSAVHWDGSNDILDLSGAALDIMRNVGYGYVFAVIKRDITAGTERFVYFSNGTNAGLTRFGAEAGRTIDRLSIQKRRLDGDSSVTATSSISHTLDYILYTGISIWAVGPSMIVRQDGVQVGSTSGGTAGNTSNTASLKGTIGASNAGEFWEGDLCEILVYNTELTAGEIDQNEAYLADKWGITI